MIQDSTFSIPLKAFDNIPSGIVLIDSRSNLIYQNSRAQSILGFSTEELNQIISNEKLKFSIHRKNINDKPADYFLENDQDFVDTQIEIKLNGMLKKLTGSLSTTLDDNNGIMLLFTFNPIEETNKPLIDSILQKRDNFLSEIIDTLPDMLYIKDSEFRYLYYNQAYADHLGTDLSDAIGKTDHSFYSQKEANKFTEEDRNIIESGISIRTKNTIRYLTKTIVIDSYKSPLKNNLGETEGIIAIGRDITKIDKITRSLDAIQKVQQELIFSQKINRAIENSLRILLEATKSHRAYIFKNDYWDEISSISQIFEIASDKQYEQLENPNLQHASYDELGFGRWKKILANNNIVEGPVENLPEEERPILESQNIKSILVVPILTENQFYGFIGLDNCEEKKKWGKHEISLLKTGANAFGRIIERKNTVEIIKRKNNSLTKTNQELDNFVYRVSHDLKSPITSLKGLLNLMQLEKDNPREMDNYMSLQKKQLDILENFIGEILDYSRNSRLEPKPEEIDFTKLINETLLQFDYIEDQNKINREVKVHQPNVFLSDSLRLKFVLNNLISNAFKFKDHSKDSFIKIKVDQLGEDLKIIVTDNGQGIAEEHVPRIFDMFYRATATASGSGLGLYIVKESVEKLNGHIEIDSTLGEGTTVTVSLKSLEPL